MSFFHHPARGKDIHIAPQCEAAAFTEHHSAAVTRCPPFMRNKLTQSAPRWGIDVHKAPQHGVEAFAQSPNVEQTCSQSAPMWGKYIQIAPHSRAGMMT